MHIPQTAKRRREASISSDDAAEDSQRAPDSPQKNKSRNMESELCSPETRMLSVDRDSSTVHRKKLYWSSIKKDPKAPGRGDESSELLKLIPTPQLPGRGQNS